MTTPRSSWAGNDAAVQTTIRPYRASDRRDLYDVCVRTADAGGAARPDDVMLHLHHHPERLLVPELAPYPAHPHITANTSARRFDDALGFQEIDVADPGPLTYLGRATVAPPSTT